MYSDTVQRMQLAEVRLPSKPTLRLCEIGAFIGVGSRQVRRYCDLGLLPTERTLGGQRVVRLAQAELFLVRFARGEFAGVFSRKR